MEETRRRSPKYFLLLVFILLLGVLAAVVLMDRLYEALTDYEAKTPNTALNQYFDRIGQKDFDVIREESGFATMRYISWEDFDAAVLEKFGGLKTSALTYKQVASNNPDGRRVYIIYKGEERLGEVYLYEGEGADGGWRVVTPLTYLPLCTVIAPPHATVLVNGEALGAAEAVESRAVETDFFAEMPQGEAAPVLLTYQIEGFLTEPVLGASSPENTRCVTAYDDGTRTMTVELLAAGDLLDACAARIEEIAKAYVRYISGAVGFYSLSSYLLPNTDFYTRMATFDHQWYASFTFRSFQEVSVSNIVSHTESCVTGDIELVSEVLRGAELIDYELSFTMSLVYVNGRWMLLELKVR